MISMFDGTALASDDCSKHQVHVAWEGIAAFTSAYDWAAAVCTPSSLPHTTPAASLNRELDERGQGGKGRGRPLGHGRERRNSKHHSLLFNVEL